MNKYNEASNNDLELRDMDSSKDLIAVITAAILAMTEGNTKIVVKSIRRTSKGLSNWVLAGWLKNNWK